MLALFNLAQGYFYGYGSSKGRYSYNSSTHTLTTGNYTAGNYKTEWGLRRTGIALDEMEDDGILGRDKTYTVQSYCDTINNMYIPVSVNTFVGQQYSYEAVYIYRYSSVEYSHTQYWGYGGLGYRYSNSPINSSNKGANRTFNRSGSTYEYVNYVFIV